MKTRISHLCVTTLAIGAIASPCLASDHADPMSLNIFQLQEDPAANLTDLDAFLADAEGLPCLTPESLANADQLIVNLCVRRRLLPRQTAWLDEKERLTHYSFRVHFDFNPELRFFNPAKTRSGEDFAAALKALDDVIPAAVKARDDARKAAPPMGNAISTLEADAQRKLDDIVSKRKTLVDQHQADDLMQRLYGGILDNPAGIAEEAMLDFHVNFDADGENSEASLDEDKSSVQGIPGKINAVVDGRRSLDGTKDVVTAKPFKPGEINVQAGVFDDPFIFPRFFRGNVVGIVTSIPLSHLHRPDGLPVKGHSMLVWATTHKDDGTQSDHVGRSLRTQLPRFGYLNTLPPSQHVAEISRVHMQPTLMENGLATFLSPLEAHRHYDSTPDVMIYDLSKPAKFPNGRWLADDVSQLLADAGETLLFELAYTESKQSPRATINDKEFRATFPYLAPRWTTKEIADLNAPGARFGEFDLGESKDAPEAHNAAIPGTKLTGQRVPDPQESDVIAPPDFRIIVWRSIHQGLLIGIIALGALAFYLSRGVLPKLAMLVIALSSLCAIKSIKADRVANTDAAWMTQPLSKFHLMLAGTGTIAFFGLWSLYAFGIRRGRSKATDEKPVLLGDQRPQQADYQYDGTTFNEVRDAVMTEPYYGSIWGETNDKPLPIYKTTFERVARGMFSLTKRFLFLDAAQRTLISHADLRKGNDGKGVERLVHPNGICLTGRWKINTDCPTDYTGYFAKGSEGLCIARYSTGLKVNRGQMRTLSMVGKLYPTTNRDEKHRTASFITQEDLGAAYSEGIHDAVLRNAPNITITNRFPDLATLFLFAFTFGRADNRNSERQLYEVAELGKPDNVPTKCPRFMQLTINKEASPKVGGGDENADFRDEILAHIYDRGVAKATRKLVFNIEVSDVGEVTGKINKGVTGAEWINIGSITFDEAAASPGGDFIIHFHHPKWRLDRNAPGTESGPVGIFNVVNKIIEKFGPSKS